MFDCVSDLIENNPYEVTGSVLATAFTAPVIAFVVGAVASKYFEIYYKNNPSKDGKSLIEKNVNPISFGIGVMAGIIAIPVIFILFMVVKEQKRLELFSFEIDELNKKLMSLCEANSEETQKIINATKQLTDLMRNTRV